MFAGRLKVIKKICEKMMCQFLKLINFHPDVLKMSCRHSRHLRLQIIAYTLRSTKYQMCFCCLTALSLRRPSVDSQEGEGRSLGQGIADLEEAREEVVAEVLNAPKRRVDNEVSRLSDSVCVLQMHCKIIEDISSKYQAALLRTRVSLAAASFTSVLLPSATIIFTYIVPDSGVALTVSNTVLFGNPLISFLTATTGRW